LTGQISVKRGTATHKNPSYIINLPGWNENAVYTWPQLKEQILNPKKAGKKSEDPRIACRKQISNGQAFKLYFKKLSSKRIVTKADDSSDEDSDNKGSMTLD
jgi:hypothetical protein